MIKNNWHEEFRQVAMEVCDSMPFRAFGDVDLFLTEFKKLSCEEQLCIIAKMVERDDIFEGKLKDEHREQLSYINKDNLDKDVKFLVTVIFTWHNPDSDPYTEDGKSVRNFVSDYYIDDIEDKTVQKVINTVWKCCTWSYENEPPHQCNSRYQFNYRIGCSCYITVESTPLLIEGEWVKDVRK